MLSNAFARGKTPESLGMATAAEMASQLDAEVRTRRTVAALERAGPGVTLDDGGSIEAARIVLGIGAQQADPGLAGDAADQVFAVNDLESYARVRRA
ncbi:MAG: hypothetical protein U5K43_09735 [Halofilum sp. (in: g-proteobacteria)]|nr:hypothetical protein [Halofilum sp. (in: g-proteobacteria)]